MKKYYKENLESDRLVTRWLTEKDIPAWVEFISDKEAMEYFPLTEFSSDIERAEFWIRKQTKRYEENEFGLQALIDKNSKEFVGQCGLLTQDIDGIIELELGYHVFPKFWGKGYAPEAAKMFIDFAFANQLSDSVVSIIDVGNRKSERVAEKNGLKKDFQTNWKDLEVNIFRVRLDDWN